MQHNKINKCALAVKLGLLVGSAALSMPAFAADEVEKAQEVEVIEIRGIRASQEANLNAKRFNDGTVDMITAEDLGKFPDKNVAESLQRIPGITIQRQFGEGAGVSIRGAGLDLTLTTLNGQNVASTGWFVLEPAKRSFNYELLPSELVGDLEVYKSSQADLAEGGVGGTVIVNTRKPLDLDALTAYASVEAAYQTDSGETDPMFSGLGSWKNDDETFGVLVAGVLQNRSLQRQGNEAFWQWGAGPVGFEQDRERTALTATFQYRPTDALNIVFNAMDMQMAANNTNFALWLTQADTTWGDTSATEAWTTYPGLDTRTPVKGPLNVAFWQARPREATMKSKVFDLKVDYQGENYLLEFQLGDTSSTGGTDFEMVLEDGTGGTPIPGGSYDFTGKVQTWDVNGFDLTNYDPGTLAMGTGANFNRTPKSDEETYAQADITFDVDYGPINAVKFGAKVSQHNTWSRKFDFIQADGFNPVISTDGLNTGTFDIGTANYQMIRFDPDALKAWARSSIVGETEDLGAYSEIDEDNYAMYAMAKFSTEGIRGNFGLRYVTTDAKSTYFVDGVQGSSSADYAEFLPSFNIAFDVAPDVIVRASAARVMARPQYADMYVNPNVMGIDDDVPNNQRWIVGNIGLKPFVGDQFDLGIEWYFNANSLLSAALFAKDVKNFVNISTSTATPDQIPFELVREDERGFGWIVEEKGNGKDAQITGMELQYQQDFGNGFGSIVNYTYTDTSTDADTFADLNPVLSDSSRHSYNLSGYYENDVFQARLSYNWRSEYMIREAGSYGNRLHDDYGSLDMSIVWSVTDNIDIKVDAVNLLEEGSKQIGQNRSAAGNNYNGFAWPFPVFQYDLARRISVGASFRF